MASASVVVLFGGSSSERRVSVATAQNVSAKLPLATPWFWAPDGAIHQVSREQLAAHAAPFENDFAPGAAATYPSLERALDAEGGGKVFFLGLHGGAGEDGSVQALFERRRLAFTGSGSVASAQAFDKVQAKRLAEAQGARVASARVLEPDAASAASVTSTLRELFALRPRWVLKPVADGSSTGLIHLVRADQVAAAAEQISAAKVRYLAEEYVAGRELTVGVVHDGSGLTALPVSEVRLAANATFDYAGKYLGRGTEELTPAPIDRAWSEAAQSLAMLAHRAVGCFGYSRTDMILTTAGPVFLEVNTLPGLTRASFIPQQLEAAGRDFKAFLDRQLELALQRPERG